ncbi:ABC transporter substrate-binding protein [Neopusillimonas maritima]|jgi:branched-chain amino acid transport system substrate-binding protein|uniref:Branched-chain amino acid ABC transporter substrate-binding protein n=1 Tax=Neopusillimonas maritima TaxID=2026239 RepID=A0ABX9MV03_9BURK|nr:ABC transporter substrate-binding protein [Neopusillimonas maritima]RII82755.1 branched-chain amino acid ABC transporter substrate-binding protein [Neopusillimonas maritima]
MKNHALSHKFAAAFAICAAFASGSALADIKIGINVPLTGFAAADGNSALTGAKLAVKKANANGGINGEQIELVIYDDQASAKDAIPAATKLIEKDEVVGAVSGSYSAATRAAAGVFQNAQVPYVVAYSIDPSITRTGDYMFRVSSMGEVQGRAGAKLVDNLGKKRVVLVTLNNDFGQALANGFKDAAPKFNLDIINEYEYGIKDRQFGPLIAKIKSDDPEVIYASGYFFNAGPLVSQIRAAGITVPIIGQEGYDSDKFIEIAGPAAEGTLVTTSLDRDSESKVTQAFLKEFREEAGFGADMVAASTYSATAILLDGLRETGGKGGAALRDAIAKGTYEMPIGKLQFNDLHEVNKDVQVQTIKDGYWARHSVIHDPELLAAPTKNSK